MLFESLTEEGIQQGLRELRDRQLSQNRQEISEIDIAYMGGPDAIRFLQMRPKESAEKWAFRKSRFRYPNYFRFIVDYFARGMYGGEVMREYENGTDAENAELDAILEYNDFASLQRMWGSAAIRWGDAWVNVKFDQWDEQLVILPVHALNIDWEMDPDNPRRLRALVETRPFVDANDNEKTTVWVWVDDPTTQQQWGRAYDQDGNRRKDLEGDGFDPNPYELIPYVKLSSVPLFGLDHSHSMVRDLLSLQKALVNQLSDQDSLVGYQSHGVPWMRYPTGQAPNTEMAWGPDGMVILEGDTSELGFASPDAKITEVMESTQQTIDQMFETAPLPKEAMSGSVAESGVALRIRWSAYVAVVESLRHTATVTEQHLADVLAAVGDVHGIPLPVDKKLLVQWSDAVLPTDTELERREDRADITNEPSLLALSDYVTKWVEGIDNQQDAEEYLERAKQEIERFRPSMTQTAGVAGGRLGELFPAGNGGPF